ncbi:hypothetical protein FKX85_00190 [Echinicola soli]|uniref:Outer membrane protein beta-barrel domain-containing protein n=1 Tax=Echinicola soli TaxID=2591634 RepID=A0A514CCK7_9BACT|nr:hypothetical protein [Echinicola soli]QDH77543.1 hypothetical protein FKX85_00190 [Echinicola soli]
MVRIVFTLLVTMVWMSELPAQGLREVGFLANAGLGYQLDLVDHKNSSPLGPVVGLSYSFPVRNKPLQFGLQFHYFKSGAYEDRPEYHYYQGWSLRASGVYLYEIPRLGKGRLFAGPGIACHQVLSREETGDHAPDFGALIRVVYQFPDESQWFNLYSDFDLITGAGYFRATLGVAVRL